MKYHNVGKHLVCVVILLIGFRTTVTAQAQEDNSVASLLNRAYTLLQTDPQQATKLFEEARDKEPENINTHRQLGYLYQSQTKYEDALNEFRKSEDLRSSDTIKLQIGYVLVAMNKFDNANEMFSDVSNSNDPEIRKKAAEAMVSASSSALPKIDRWWTHLYTVPYYDTRWNSWFYDAFVKEGYYLTYDKILSAYGIAAISGDSRSSGGLVPQVFSDNSFLLGVGLRAKPFNGFIVEVQQGVAFDLIDKGNSSKTKGDFRAVAVYSNGMYAPFELHDELKTPFIPFADLYTSFGYYSRYKNGIGYLQARGGFRALEVSHSVADVYARFDVVRDTEKEFFNNFVEWGIGTRITPNIDWGLHLAVEYKRGVYWSVSNTVIPVDSYYNSVRFFLIFERMW